MQAAVQVSLDLDLAHCKHACAGQRTVPFEVEALVFNDLSLAPEGARNCSNLLDPNSRLLLY